MSDDRASSTTAVNAGVAVEPVTPLSAVCWGTRGSLPSPGPGTVRHGGNTSCLEVVSATGHRLIFDAGSGIRPLGEAVGGAPVDADLFLTHFHWDHIQGLPFFAPMYDPRSSLRIHGARQGELDVQALVAGQMGPIYFPVPFDALEARLEFYHVNGGVFERGGMRVSTHRVRHPTHTYGYRVDAGACAVAYLPDNELVGGSYDVGPRWRQSLISFLRDVDVLYHDAMYTADEYERFEGWGHSAIPDAVRLAEDAGVRTLCLFHHAPGRRDEELERLLEEAREELAKRGSGLTLRAAAEGERIMVEEPK